MLAMVWAGMVQTGIQLDTRHSNGLQPIGRPTRQLSGRAKAGLGMQIGMVAIRMNGNLHSRSQVIGIGLHSTSMWRTGSF